MRGLRLALVLVLMCLVGAAQATVSTSASSTTIAGNGSTTAFTYAFIIPSASEAVVSVTNTTVTPNVTATLAASAYSISGLGNAAGGTVTYPLSGPALGVGYFITIARVLPLVQTTSISNQGAFYPQVIEKALDYQMQAIQQLQAQINTMTNEITTGAPIVYSRFRQILTGYSDTASTTDSFIAWNSAAATSKTENLFACNAAAIGATLIIADRANTSGTYPVLIIPNGGDTIVPAASGYLNSNGESVNLTCDGNAHWIAN